MELIILTIVAITFFLGVYLAVRVISPVVSTSTDKYRTNGYGNYSSMNKSNQELDSFKKRIIRKTVLLHTAH